jgi:hypothetical protein
MLLQGAVSPPQAAGMLLQGAVSPLQAAGGLLQGAVSPLQAAGELLQGAVSPLQAAGELLQGAVSPLQAADGFVCFGKFCRTRHRHIMHMKYAACRLFLFPTQQSTCPNKIYRIMKNSFYRMLSILYT